MPPIDAPRDDRAYDFAKHRPTSDVARVGTSASQLAEIPDDIDHVVASHPVSGDWFHLCVSYTYGKVTIARISLWALVRNKGQVDHFKGVGPDGMPICRDGAVLEASYYVYGPDRSPTGTTWAEVYAAAEVSRMLSWRDVTPALGQLLSHEPIDLE